MCTLQASTCTPLCLLRPQKLACIPHAPRSPSPASVSCDCPEIPRETFHKLTLLLLHVSPLLEDVTTAAQSSPEQGYAGYAGCTATVSCDRAHEMLVNQPSSTKTLIIHDPRGLRDSILLQVLLGGSVVSPCGLLDY